ncbi:hypothetical protein PoB_002871700 [Plakobranchus ocellatus]|uniref:Uncharacterized protein n=1 Tax=Plakobranchus ocellatus TaxID=259542 RepID=A0AAV4A4K7_9GAST|nr:hypothetical protein PoB_002871700 [Plakobranchus ocellatus]
MKVYEVGPSGDCGFEIHSKHPLIELPCPLLNLHIIPFQHEEIPQVAAQGPPSHKTDCCFQRGFRRPYSKNYFCMQMFYITSEKVQVTNGREENEE